MLKQILRIWIPLIVIVSLLVASSLPVNAANAPVISSQYPTAGATGITVTARPYVNFSQAMDATTINTTNIQLMNGSSVITASVALSGTKKALITPTSSLDYNTTYYILVGTGVTDTNGLDLESAYGSAASSSFTTAAPLAPAVSQQYPARSALNVPLNVQPYILFSKDMDYTTINSTNIQLMQNGTPVSAGLTLSGTNKAIITPDANLSGSTLYYIVVSTAVKDVTGLALANTYGSSTLSRFTTAAATPPTITSTYPLDNASAVPFRIQPYINFSKSMDSSTINSTNIQLLDNSTPVAVTVTLSNYTRAVITPAVALDYSTTYSMVVGTAVKDAFGNALAAAATLTFTTDNNDPPSISSFYPADQSSDVAIQVQPAIVFSEAIDPATLNTTNIKLMKGTSTVKSSVALYGNRIAILTPQSSLLPGTQYSILVTTGIKDSSGNAITAPSTTTFTTTPNADIPVVVSQYPAADSEEIPVNVTPCVVFSKPMKSTTINSTNIILKSGTTTIRSSVRLYGKYSAVITPSAPLNCGTIYYITVSTAVKDTDGNSPAAAYGSAAATAFTTLSSSFSLLSQYPVDNATEIPIDIQPCIVFSRALTASTVNTANIQLLDNSTPVNIRVSLADDRSVLIVPAAALSVNGSYSIVVGTGVEDSAGNALTSQVITRFTTVAANNAPTVVYQYPSDSGTGVPLDVQMCLVFSAQMDDSSVTTANIQLLQGSTPVTLRVALYGHNTVVITPASRLALNTQYSLVIGSGVKDLNGNTMQPTTTTFTTSAS